jgi:hypothetical protein
MSICFKNKFRDSQNRQKLLNNLLLEKITNRNNKILYNSVRKGINSNTSSNVKPILEENKTDDNNMLDDLSSGKSEILENKFIQTDKSIIINDNFIEITL